MMEMLMIMIADSGKLIPNSYHFLIHKIKCISFLMIYKMGKWATGLNKNLPISKDNKSLPKT